MINYRVEFPGLGINLNINPVFIHIGNLSLRWYGLLIALGFATAFIYVIKSCSIFKLDPDKLINAILVGFITGTVGARLYYVVFYPGNKYINEPLSILYIHEGGLAIYGAIIGGIVGALIIANCQKINILAMLDVASLGFSIGQSIGRWGNFTNQEAFGCETDLPWRMVSVNTGFIGVHPCFLYESLLCASIFLVLHVVSRKYRKFNGQVFFLYMILYGCGRYFIEGLRSDSLYIPNTNIKVSQALSLLIFLFGLVFYVLLKNKKELNIKSSSKKGSESSNKC